MNSLLFFLPHITWTSELKHDVARLLLAAVLGGFIGLERELKRRPAGLRTNMFICFGAAMFTILSMELAGKLGSGEGTRIASQIIPGIGFIGAGSILRARGNVTGLTTAATIFVVASIGMACGGGFYVLAIFASLLIFIALRALGWMETQFSLKQSVMNYIVLSEKSESEMVAELHSVLDRWSKEPRGLHLTRREGKQCLAFSVDATRREQKELMEALHRSEALRNFEVKTGPSID